VLVRATRRTRIRRRPRLASRTLSLAVVQLGAAALLLGVVELVVLFVGAPDPPWVVALFPVLAWIHMAAGAVAWWRRPANRMGAILVMGCFVWLSAGLANTTLSPLVAIGLVTASAPLGVVVHLLHAFPTGRLRGRLSRTTVLAGYGVCLVLEAPLYLFGADSPLQVADRHGLERAGFWLQISIGAAVMAATAATLAGRLDRMTHSERRISGPLLAYGTVAVILVPLIGGVKQLFPWGALELAATQLGLLAAVPILFSLALIRGGFAPTGELEELGAWLGVDHGARPGLEGALADALGDPSVELLFWVPDAGGYVDAAGRVARLPAVDGRGIVEVASAGRRVGAIVYDAGLFGDTHFVRTAGQVVARALGLERLSAELRVSGAGLRRSRARLVEAADRERRRVARDLHDGLQTRLVLLAVEAQRAGAPQLREGLRAAIDELRELVAGVMPVALTQGGLYGAAEELADRAPVPVELELEPGPDGLPPAVETTGWFVLSEAVTNAVKHAHARELRLYLGQADGCLTIVVDDDGIGGAIAGSGAGLRGMADRVEAHDGRLVVDSPPGGGTRIVAEVPCGS
jgi:signal transduction histidine kinase